MGRAARESVGAQPGLGGDVGARVRRRPVRALLTDAADHHVAAAGRDRPGHDACAGSADVPPGGRSLRGVHRHGDLGRATGDVAAPPAEEDLLRRSGNSSTYPRRVESSARRVTFGAGQVPDGGGRRRSCSRSSHQVGQVGVVTFTDAAFEPSWRLSGRHRVADLERELVAHDAGREAGDGRVVVGHDDGRDRGRLGPLGRAVAAVTPVGARCPASRSTLPQCSNQVPSRRSCCTRTVVPRMKPGVPSAFVHAPPRLNESSGLREVLNELDATPTVAPGVRRRRVAGTGGRAPRPPACGGPSPRRCRGARRRPSSARWRSARRAAR